MTRPSRIVLSGHAERRRREIEVTREQVVDILDQHPNRRSNPRSADWLIESGGLAIAYNWPHNDDESSAFVVTIYSRG